MDRTLPVAFHRFTVDEAQALGPVPMTFTSSVLGMEAISHAIEVYAASLTYPVEVFAAFQKLSNATVQQERYAAILEAGSHVTLFGDPDWAAWTHPNLQVVELPADHPLADAWIVALHDPTHLSMALLAHELPDRTGQIRRQGALVGRQFAAGKSYDARIVESLVAALRAVAADPWAGRT